MENEAPMPYPRNRSLILSTTLLLVTLILASMVAFRTPPEIIRMNLEDLPMEIDGYKAVEARFSESVYQALNADRHIYRHYYTNQGERIDLYIGYYGTAKGGRSSHLPEACLPGAGWGIVDREQITVQPDDLLQDAVVNYILSRKGHQYQCMIHWYQSAGDKVLSSGIRMNIQRFIGRVFFNRNDGAFVQVSAITTSKNDIPGLRDRLKSFAEKILTLLPHYWPEEG